jgi:MFS family permease
MPKKNHTSIAILILIVASLLYVYEFYLRVIPSVITQELMHDLSINASQLGFISSLFYLSYTIMQIPAGLLVDRFGPRRLLSFATLICAFATLLSAVATNGFLAGVSRFLIGFGASFAYACPLIVAKYWFPPQRFAMIGGCVQTLGAMGAIIGNEPVAYLTNQIGWRWACIYSGLFGLLQTVMRNPQTWCIAVVGLCYWAPMTVFAELWGRSFITQIHHINTEQASMMMCWVWVGVAFGGPFFGWLSNAIKSRKIPIYLSLLIVFFATFSLIYYPCDSIIWIDFCLFLFGFASASQCVTFGIVNDINPKAVVGTAIGLNNMAVISGGIIHQPFVSYLLGKIAISEHLGQPALYSLADYQYAFLALPITTIVGFLVCFFFIKETHAKPKF